MIVVLKELSFLKKGYVLVRGSTEYDIPTLPSRVGIRDVFYLDSLGKDNGPVAPRKKVRKPSPVSCIYINPFSVSCQDPFGGFAFAGPFPKILFSFFALLTSASIFGLSVGGIASALCGSNLV